MTLLSAYVAKSVGLLGLLYLLWVPAVSFYATRLTGSEGPAWLVCGVVLMDHYLPTSYLGLATEEVFGNGGFVVSFQSAIDLTALCKLKGRRKLDRVTLYVLQQTLTWGCMRTIRYERSTTILRTPTGYHQQN